MIKANELRIGNWVEFAGSYFQVHTLSKEVLQISGDGIGAEVFKYDNTHPIPLTEEILLKCGYKWSIQHQAFKNNNSKWVIAEGHVYQNVRGGFFLCKIEYLHQLQNLLFAVEGQELTINP